MFERIRRTVFEEALMSTVAKKKIWGKCLNAVRVSLNSQATTSQGGGRLFQMSESEGCKAPVGGNFVTA
ncbi:hypothetical protein GcM3_081004c [Golovinomyces cichoracearum]|uniref:Uncharacterized protein n=1 Tax=Golovinomyces cichoracearum TaxID=62708 RepID=A0A420IN73_9PEZI|nr:hypothetical protein GcM3_081004c [Golovinomyces cichoracearum]